MVQIQQCQGEFGMATVLAAVKADDGSRFLRYDGSEIPW